MFWNRAAFTCGKPPVLFCFCLLCEIHAAIAVWTSQWLNDSGCFMHF